MDSIIIIKSTFPFSLPSHFPSQVSTKHHRPFKVTIKSPLSRHRLEISKESRDYMAESYQEMLSLAGNGSFGLVRKRRYGPVSYWIRTEFVEPEEISLVETGNYPCCSRATYGGKAPSADFVSRAGIMYVYASADDELGNH